MKAHWECNPDGKSYLTLEPENTDEMEQLANVVIYAGTNDDREPQDDTPEGFNFEAASAYGESETTSYAAGADTGGEVMTRKINGKHQGADIEIRLWRKR